MYVSQFGRIPQATVALLEQTRDQVRNEVLPALPVGAGQMVRDSVLRQVIGIVLRDWREHENAQGLGDEDVEDMRNFVKAAATIAGPDLNGQGAAVFDAVLEGLLEDWLHNWNTQGDPGPPGPVD